MSIIRCIAGQQCRISWNFHVEDLKFAIYERKRDFYIFRASLQCEINVVQIWSDRVARNAAFRNIIYRYPLQFGPPCIFQNYFQKYEKYKKK